jgi:hypothetical protein
MLATTAPLHAQDRAWHDQWFWGAQGGVTRFKTATAGWESAFAFGGHWLITGTRMGLYLSYDQLLYDSATSVITDPSSGTGARTVQFDNGRYIQADLLAMPLQGNLQFVLGAGITIHNISDASVQGTFATAADHEFSQALAEDAATRAFFNVIGGFNLMVGSRLGVFANYQFISSARDFLVTSEQHAFWGGLRYSFGGRREEVTTGR